MNATDLVIGPPGRLFARTSPRARRIEQAAIVNQSRALAPDLITAARGRVTEEPGQCACGLAIESASGHIYNEEAFQYFLSIERKRAEAGGHRLLLALIDLKALAGENALDGAAPDLFAALRECLRETDFVGWYEPGVAGVVLPQFCNHAPNAGTRRVAQRLCHGLGQFLPAQLASRLEVHVYEFPSADQI
jgi:hypothetical protein